MNQANRFSQCSAITLILLLSFVACTSGLPQGYGSSSTDPVQCLVKENSSGEIKPCIFPFSHNTLLHSTCTNASDADGKYW